MARVGENVETASPYTEMLMLNVRVLTPTVNVDNMLIKPYVDHAKIAVSKNIDSSALPLWVRILPTLLRHPQPPSGGRKTRCIHIDVAIITSARRLRSLGTSADRTPMEESMEESRDASHGCGQ